MEAATMILMIGMTLPLLMAGFVAMTQTVPGLMKDQDVMTMNLNQAQLGQLIKIGLYFLIYKKML